MKIKKFNEQVDDPYGEEVEGELELGLIKNFAHTPGVCVACGSENIHYGEMQNWGDQIAYEYRCMNCHIDGL